MDGEVTCQCPVQGNFVASRKWELNDQPSGFLGRQQGEKYVCVKLFNLIKSVF